MISQGIVYVGFLYEHTSKIINLIVKFKQNVHKKWKYVF